MFWRRLNDLPSQLGKFSLDMRRYLPQSHRHKENGHLILNIRLAVEVEGIKALHLAICCLKFFVTCFDWEFGAYVVVVD